MQRGWTHRRAQGLRVFGEFRIEEPQQQRLIEIRKLPQRGSGLINGDRARVISAARGAPDARGQVLAQGWLFIQPPTKRLIGSGEQGKVKRLCEQVGCQCSNTFHQGLGGRDESQPVKRIDPRLEEGFAIRPAWRRGLGQK